jgi:hypothetical protein
MGRPRGLARSTRALADRNPATAAVVEAFLKNSLLEIADIRASSSEVESGWGKFTQSRELSHDSETIHECGSRVTDRKADAGWKSQGVHPNILALRVVGLEGGGN